MIELGLNRVDCNPHDASTTASKARPEHDEAPTEQELHPPALPHLLDDVDEFLTGRAAGHSFSHVETPLSTIPPFEPEAICTIVYGAALRRRPCPV